MIRFGKRMSGINISAQRSTHGFHAGYQFQELPSMVGVRPGVCQCRICLVPLSMMISLVHSPPRPYLRWVWGGGPFLLVGTKEIAQSSRFQCSQCCQCPEREAATLSGRVLTCGLYSSLGGAESLSREGFSLGLLLSWASFLDE